jgi:hypothetical protein
VPSPQELDKMQQDQQKQQQAGLPAQMIQEAVNKGMADAIKRITTELAAAGLGGQEGMPMGMPTHIGTPGSMPVPGAHVGTPAPGGTPQGGMTQAAAQAQGRQPTPLTAQGGPQLANSVSNTPGAGAKPISPGPG